MIKEAIEKILSLAPAQVFEINGIQHVKEGDKARAVLPLEQACLKLSTLSGLVDYVKNQVDGDMKGSSFIHVIDHETVSLSQVLNEKTKQRANIIVCDLNNHGEGFSFGKQHQVEEFIIALQARFVPTTNLSKVLSLVGNMKAEKVTSATDDGISQKIATGSGVVLMTESVVPNPVSLKPYRTFREIEQPDSNFVFRLSQRGSELPTCALHEADGGQWKLEAIQKIRDYFKSALPDMKVIA